MNLPLTNTEVELTNKLDELANSLCNDRLVKIKAIVVDKEFDGFNATGFHSIQTSIGPIDVKIAEPKSVFNNSIDKMWKAITDEYYPKGYYDPPQMPTLDKLRELKKDKYVKPLTLNKYGNIERKLIMTEKFARMIDVNDSEWITRIGYNLDTLELGVRTKSGKNYIYDNISPLTWARISTAKSVGRSFNAEINGLAFQVVND